MVKVQMCSLILHLRSYLDLLRIAACLAVQSVFIFPAKMKKEADKKHKVFAVYEGDHLTMLNAYNGFLENNKSSKFCHSHFLNFRSLSRAVDVRAQVFP